MTGSLPLPTGRQARTMKITRGYPPLDGEGFRWGWILYVPLTPALTPALSPAFAEAASRRQAPGERGIADYHLSPITVSSASLSPRHRVILSRTVPIEIARVG